jgi:hypothetical protein
MATITGDHVGYPGFQDLGNFSPRRKILGGAKIRTSFGVEFLQSQNNLFFFQLKVSYLDLDVFLSSAHS